MINDFYLRAADLPADTRSLVTEWIEAHPRRLQWAVRRTRQYFGYLDHCNDLTRLAVVLAMLPDTHEKYRQLGIEDTVFAETMSDIGIWCANCGGGGLHNVHWIKNHLDARLFRLGRLQFQLYRLPPVAAYPHTAPLMVGAPVVYIHIPQGAPLETEACRLSIARARAFFDRVFPDYAYTCFLAKAGCCLAATRILCARGAIFCSLRRCFIRCATCLSRRRPWSGCLALSVAAQRITRQRRTCNGG